MEGCLKGPRQTHPANIEFFRKSEKQDGRNPARLPKCLLVSGRTRGLASSASAQPPLPYRSLDWSASRFVGTTTLSASSRYLDSHEADMPESWSLASLRNTPKGSLIRNASDPQRGPENRETLAILANPFHLLGRNIEEFESIDAPGRVANCSIDLRTRYWFQLDQVPYHQNRNGRSGNPAFADLNAQSAV
jgi:hypothetical protein